MGSGTRSIYDPADFCPWMKRLRGEAATGLGSDVAQFFLGRDDQGVNFRVYGATTGRYIEWDQSADQLHLYWESMTENEKPFNVEVAPTDLTHGARQGAIFVGMSRSASYAMTGWDGNPDCGLKMQVYNRAANTTARGAVRGFDVLARNRDSVGSCVWLNGGYVCAENSTGSGGVVDVIGFEVHAKNNGVASGDVKVMRVYDESQSYTGTSYAIEISCTNDSAFTREYCIYINSGASSGWTNGLTFDGNITNAFDFADIDGTNGATYESDGMTPGTCKGKIRVDVGGTDLYIALYDAVAS